MAWKLLHGWKEWLFSRRHAVARNLNSAGYVNRSIQEEPFEAGGSDKGWVWEFRCSLSKRPRGRRGAMTRRGREENRRMPIALNDEELAVLRILEDANPAPLHLHDVGQRLVGALDKARLLVTVDWLLARSLIQGRPLRGSEGLADAANLRLTDEGVKTFERMAQGEQLKAMRKPAQASVLNVLIASPSDVAAERDAVESAVHEWNASHFPQTGLMLRPVRWEKNSFPASGNRAQGVLNKQMVEDAHFLIGVFGSRLGTPTGVADSGTLEEIERFLATGRHVALYFSSAPVARDVDRAQLAALEAYQRKRQEDSLYATFGSVEDLRRQVAAHLPRTVASVQQTMRSGAGEAEMPQKERKHNIVFLNAEVVKLAYSGPGFSERTDGQHSFSEVKGVSTGDMIGLVARFRNEAIYGENVATVRSVRAHLKLLDRNGKEIGTGFSSAQWLVRSPPEWPRRFGACVPRGQNNEASRDVEGARRSWKVV